MVSPAPAENPVGIARIAGRPAFLTALLFAAWLVLAKTSFLPNGVIDVATEATPTAVHLTAGADPSASGIQVGVSSLRHSILEIGVMPWIWATFVLQVLWTMIPWLSGYFSHEEKATRPESLRFIFVVAFAIFLAQSSNVLGRLEHEDLVDLAAGYMGSEIPSALLIGMIASGFLALSFQRLGPGHGIGIVFFLSVLYPTAMNMHWLGRVFTGLSTAGTVFWSLYYLACIAVLVSVIGWIQRQTIELPPQTLETQDRELVPVHVPFAFLGLLPFWLGFMGLSLLRALFIGLKSQGHFYGFWIDSLIGIFSVECWLGTFVLAILTWFGTYLAFHILYPYHRLAKIIGRQEREVAEFYRPWLDSQLALYALYLVGVLVGGKLFLTQPLQALGANSLYLVLLVGTLHEIRDGLWGRIAIEREFGTLSEVTKALGLIEASVIRTRLARQGIPAALRSWSLQTILPSSVPGLGEVDVLVPETHLKKARETLGLPMN